MPQHILKSNNPPYSKAKKQFGQNFLRDDGIIQQIVQSIHAQTKDILVEIGAGDGSLTRHLLPHVINYHAIEIDRDLIAYLASLQELHPYLKIYNQDILQFDFAKISSPFRLLGNLAYNISTPLLFYLINYKSLFHDAYFMLQKEVAQRLTAQPGNKNFGRLSVMLQYHFQLTYLFDVPASAFQPIPKVESAIIHLRTRQLPIIVAHDEDQFAKLIKAAFSQPRKTLKNNLSHYISSKQWEKLDIDARQRPQTLSVQDYVKISNFLLA